MFTSIETKTIYVNIGVLPKERKIARTMYSVEMIDEFKLVSERALMSGEFSNRNDSSLQKLLGIIRMLEKERTSNA